MKTIDDDLHSLSTSNVTEDDDDNDEDTAAVFFG